MRLDLFATRFYVFDNIYDNKILANVLNAIKTDADNLAAVTAEPEGGPTYKTNYYLKDSHKSLFDPILNILNEHLIKEESAYYHINDSPWYSEYGEHDSHEPHIHDQKQINLMKVHNALKTSCIINLSNFGQTSFLNPNYTNWEDQFHHEKSRYGRVILFPSNMWHWVSPHRFAGRKRATFAMNGILTFLEPGYIPAPGEIESQYANL